MASAPSRAVDAVTIPDVQFQSCLNQSLGKTAGEIITATELATLTQLSCSGAGITDLTGAQDLINLEELDLSSNSITSLVGIGNLKHLVTVNVSSNKVADLSPLKEFVKGLVYADGQNVDLAVEVDKATLVSIKGRSGEPIIDLKGGSAALTVADANIKATTAGMYYVTFSDPAMCSDEPCADASSFNGTVTVEASVEWTTTPAPTVSGKAAIGQTLTAHMADWSPLQLDWEYQWYRDDIEIALAEASTYTVADDDRGSSLKVEVTGINTGYSRHGETLPAVVVDAPLFTATPAPTISGTPKIGETLTVRIADWTPRQESWDYQWFRNDVAVYDADDATYAVTAADAGASLKVAVTGELEEYATHTETSLPTAQVASAVFTSTAAPTITGTAALGQTLTAHVAAWAPTPDSWSYQWYRNDTRISGADDPTYTVVAADGGSSLKVELTGAKMGFQSVTKGSSPTARVAANTFTTMKRPTISGSAAVGKTLTAKVSGWVPTPDSWTYRWFRNGRVITGATNSSYLLVGSDSGKKITVGVTGIKAGSNSASQTSKATKKVTSGTFTTVRPTITGTVQVGQKLTANVTGWAPTPDRWYYRWYRNNKSISHATKSSYTLGGSDVGKKITVRVTGTKTGISTAKQTSKATVKVVAGQFSASVATITGTPKVGSKLTVVSSGWSPKPSSIHRQWYRGGDKIRHATKTTYKLAAGDLGHVITVKVTGAKKGYVTVTKTAAELHVIA